MTRNQERIVRSAQRAGLRLAQRQRGVPSREELLSVRVQVAPPWTRLLSGLSAAGAAWGSYACFKDDQFIWGVLLALLALLLFFFMCYGVRRTLYGLADSFDGASAGVDLVGEVVKLVFAVLE
jgi:hypothetical protein